MKATLFPQQMNVDAPQRQLTLRLFATGWLALLLFWLLAPSSAAGWAWLTASVAGSVSYVAWRLSWLPRPALTFNLSLLLATVVLYILAEPSSTTTLPLLVAGITTAATLRRNVGAGMLLLGWLIGLGGLPLLTWFVVGGGGLLTVWLLGRSGREFDGREPAGLPPLAHTQALAELAQILTTQDSQEIYRRAIRVVANNIRASHYSITRWDSDGRQLRRVLTLAADTPESVAVPQVIDAQLNLDAWPTSAHVIQTRQSLRETEQRPPAQANPNDPLTLAGPFHLLEVPLVANAQLVGTLQLFRAGKQAAFTESELYLVELMAQQIASALHNALVTSAARARAAQLNTLNRFSQLLTQSQSLRQMYIDARREILPLFEATGISISLRNGDRDTLSWVYGYEYGAEVDLGGLGPLPLDVGFTGYVATNATPLLVNTDMEARALEFKSIQVGSSPGAWLGVPLIVVNRTIGVIAIENGDDPDAFSERDIQLLTTIAGPLAVSIDNLQQRAQTEADLMAQSEQSLLLRTAAEVSAATATTLNVAELSQRVVNLVQERFDFYYVGIFLADETRNRAVLQAGSGAIGLEQREADFQVPIGGATLVGQAIASGQIQIEREPGEVIAGPFDFRLPETVAELALPLRSRGGMVGALNLHANQRNAFSDQMITALQTLADLIAGAIENARLFAQVQDSLIRINNLFLASRQIIHADHSHTVYETLTDFANASGQADIAHLIVPDPKAPDRLIFPAIWSRADVNYNPSNYYPADTFPFSELLPSTDLVTIEDGQSDATLSQATRNLFARSGMRTAVLVPIHRENQWLGTLALIRRNVSPLTREEAQPFLTVCNQAAAALANQRLLNETNTLYRASRSLSQVITREDALSITVQELTLQTAAEQARVVMYDYRQGHGRIELEYMDTEAGSTLQFPMGGDRVFEQLRDERQPLVLRDDGSDEVTAACYLRPFGAKVSLVVPAFSQQELIGFIALDSHSSAREFTRTHINFAQTLVDQLSTQIENLALFDEALSRAQEMITLNQIGALISGTLNLDELAQVIHEQVGRLLDNSIFLLAQYDAQTRQYRPLLCTRYGERFVAMSRQIEQKDLLYQFLHTDQSIASTAQAELSRQAGLQELYVSGWVPESALWIAMQQEGEPTGLISVQSYRPHAYNENHVQLLRTIANQAGLALANAQLFQRTEQALTELQSLFDITQETAGSPNPIERLDRTTDALHDHFQGSNVSILTVDPQRQTLHVATGYLDAERRNQHLSLQSPLIRESIMHNRPVLSNDTRKHGGSTGSLEALSQMVVPLTFGERVVGLINVESPASDAFVESDLRLLQTLGVSIAATLESRRLFDEIQAANVQLRELDRLKMQFLANMSHELRTPLNSIIGFSRVILKGIDGPITDQQEEDLNAIYNSGQHLLNIINDILDVARIEAGKLALVFETIDVPALAERVLGTIRGLVRDKSIELRTDIAADLPPIEADPVRLRQILLNVLSNAAKFTQQGHILLSIQPDRTAGIFDTPGTNGNGNGSEEPFRRIRIEISDTGVGIDAADFEKIFTAFEQVDASSTRLQDGTGLGLPITKRLVNLHHGDITVTSKLGVGSTFVISLPVKQPAGGAVAQAVAQQSS